MTRAIIFDCFGVVISDVLEVICARLRAKDPAAADEVRGLVHASNRGIITPRESGEHIARILGVSYEQYRQQIAEGETKDVELLRYIKELRQTYKTALLSNIGVDSLERRFEPGELEHYFDVVVASGEIGYAKPELQAYVITAQRLGVAPEECVFVDDRSPYCEAARAASMQAILYQDLAQFRSELKTLL